MNTWVNTLKEIFGKHLNPVRGEKRIKENGPSEKGFWKDKAG